MVLTKTTELPLFGRLQLCKSFETPAQLCASFESSNIRPSRAVTVMSLSCTFMLENAAESSKLRRLRSSSSKLGSSIVDGLA
jgi:hypothetical protein